MHTHYDFSVQKYNRLKEMGFVPRSTLDIGASDGSWSKVFGGVFNESEIFSIEGNPALEEKLKLNNPNYKIALLGNVNELKTFYINKDCDFCHGSSIYKESTEYYNSCKEISLQMHRLDDLNVNNKQYDYIKIDVQGAELDIIRGGLKTILDCSFLQLELGVLEFNNGAPLSSEIIAYLYNLDFYVYDICSHFYWNNRLNQFDVIFINKQKCDSNYLKL